MTINLDDYVDLERDADSELQVSLHQHARLTRDWATYTKGTRFYIVNFIPCVGGRFLRWNARAVLTNERITDRFFYRTVPAELLRPLSITKRVYRKGRVLLVLDRSEVFPDDPGNGSPAMVYAFGAGASYGCALDNGLWGPTGEVPLTQKEWEWLDGLGREIDAFLDPPTNTN